MANTSFNSLADLARHTRPGQSWTDRSDMQSLRALWTYVARTRVDECTLTVDAVYTAPVNGSSWSPVRYESRSYPGRVVLDGSRAMPTCGSGSLVRSLRSGGPYSPRALHQAHIAAVRSVTDMLR